VSDGTGPGGDGGTGPGRFSDAALQRLFAALPIVLAMVLVIATFLAT
jgi:hypothetical protein